MNSFDKITETDILQILQRHDPMGLHALGAPLDEYKTEAHAIRARLSDEYTFNQLLILVYSVFVFYFDPILAGNVFDYTDITKEILLLKNSKPQQPTLRLVVSND